VQTAAIIGIVVAVCAIIVIGIFLLRRYKRQNVHMDLSATSLPTIAPQFLAPISTADNSDSRSDSTVRRGYAQSELSAAQEKTVNMQESERRAQVTSQGATTGRIPSVEGRRSPHADVLSQLRELTARMYEMEAQIHSPSAQQLSDGAPPGYSR
jgi:hypothetical protein